MATIPSMRVQVQRARGLLHRYRIDRRLPPPTRELYQRTARLRTEDLAGRGLAQVRPVLGGAGRPTDAARFKNRRLAVAGPLTTSMTESAVMSAHRVSNALTAAGLHPFLVDRDGDQVILGLELSERTDGTIALGTLAEEAGWFLEWHDGSGSGIVPLADASASRRAARARSWTVFRSCAVGDRATGPELGATVSFWTPGPSGQLERIGWRGQQRFDARSGWTVEDIDGHQFPGRAAFPVTNSLARFADPIDVVYTWVDGGDPEWSTSFRQTAADEGRDLSDPSLDPARFTSRDELRYSLRSLWMYCGWVRNIYIVTAGQRPGWLADDPRIRVVDHSEILPASALPTFNSHSIEASLHRIDGLSEYFVYFNDDMVVTRSLRPETFFHPNGLPYWFPSDARVPGVEDATTQAVDTAALRGRELLEDTFGRVMPFKPLHSPYPLRRSVMFEIEDRFPEVIDRTRHSRFRSPSDLSVAASFAQHYAFGTGRAVAGDLEAEYVHVESGRLSRHLDRIRLDPEVATCCINETAHEANGSRAREATISRFFREHYPIAAPWECASCTD